MKGDILTTAYTYKSGSLLSEFKIIIKNWDFNKDIKANFVELENFDHFGKNTRSWRKEILTLFKRRYVEDNPFPLEMIGGLKLVIDSFKDRLILNFIFLFHFALVDPFLQDVLLNFLWPKYRSNYSYIKSSDLIDYIDKLNLLTGQKHNYSESMKKRIARGVLSTLKDFTLLQGHQKKTFQSIFIPDECIAYILYWLKERDVKSKEIIKHVCWGFFFFTSNEIEKLMFRAHDLKLISYHQVGDTHRIDWLFNNIKEVVNHFNQG